MFSSPLQRAITRGLKPEGDLSEEISKLGDYKVKSRKDADAICAALATLPTAEDQRRFSSPLHAIVSLFQSVESRDAPAFEILDTEGTEHLIRICDSYIERPSKDTNDDLLFVLKILSMYGSREGAEKIVQASRIPSLSDAYMWHVVLAVFSADHPHSEFVFAELSDPLPQSFLAVALLDSANSVAIEGRLSTHPFDSVAGKEQLGRWLEDRNPENFSYAHSATAALPFISNPERDQLLALAMDHVDPQVQMEAAWASAKLGSEASLQVLARYCLNPSHAAVARQYLGELEREDLIPQEAQDESFQAIAEFSNWLSHPNELGRAPDEIEIVDHRKLPWAPEQDPKPFWLIKYRVKDTTGLEDDDVGCGLVGSITFCLFSYELHQRPPEDAYAIHCCWELEHSDLMNVVEVTDPTEYESMLGKWPDGPLHDPTITHIAEISHQLSVPRRLVAVASAELDGNEGWAVLDGPTSKWYPATDLPKETSGSTMLKVHIGRQLLGFEDEPNRRAFLRDSPRKDPQKFVDAYEALMAEARDGRPERQKDLLGSWSLLSSHFETYVEYLANIRDSTESATLIDVYERFLKLARGAHESVHEDVFDTLSVLGQAFEKFTDALVEAGRAPDIGPCLDTFAPHWENNLGYSQLGAAAFKMEDYARAEKLLCTLREQQECYYRGEDMSRLAFILHRRGEQREARDLMIDCLQKLVIDFKESEYVSDRQMFAENFQTHRETYQRLFPDGERDLTASGIPLSLG